MPTPITPCLWFTDHAEEAMEFYCSVFPNSHIVSIDHQCLDLSISGHQLVEVGGNNLPADSELILEPAALFAGGNGRQR